MLHIFVDSDCDITKAQAEEYGVSLISMPYFIGEKEVYPYVDFEEFEPHEYSNMLREGTIPTTAALSPANYKEIFEPAFAKGDTILYIHFSSAMSLTFDNMEKAINELKEKYPDVRFEHFDTMSMTTGAYVIVKEMLERYKKGASIDELIKWGEEERQHFACYFFADDLKFFRRSGRVSGFSAFMGGMIGIKPLININEKGIMGSFGKAIGQANALKTMVKFVEDLGEDIKNYTFVVGHTDAPLLVKKMCEMLKAKFGEDLNIEKVPCNPTAGAHSGPGGVSVAFHAKHR